MKTSVRANARAAMREGHSPSKALLMAHAMKHMAEGGVEDGKNDGAETDKWLNEPDITSDSEPAVVPESQSKYKNQMPPRKPAPKKAGW